MPLDVLKKIQDFKEGGAVVNDINAAVKNNPRLQQAFQGIANATTNGGANLSIESLTNTLNTMNAVVKATNNADLSMMGLKNSMSSIDGKPLESIRNTMSEIMANGRNIGVSLDTRQASAGIAKMSSALKRMQTNATVSMQSAPVRQPRFATGGRVTYNKQNTETAQTGGIFRRGSSTGDRNMIFANKGEGIITEKAVRQGAKQRGMSPDMYVRALNNPSINLDAFKKGRQFNMGGLVGQAIDAFLNAKDSHGNDFINVINNNATHSPDTDIKRYSAEFVRHWNKLIKLGRDVDAGLPWITPANTPTPETDEILETGDITSFNLPTVESELSNRKDLQTFVNSIKRAWKAIEKYRSTIVGDRDLQGAALSAISGSNPASINVGGYAGTYNGVATPQQRARTSRGMMDSMAFVENAINSGGGNNLRTRASRHGPGTVNDTHSNRDALKIMESAYEALDKSLSSEEAYTVLQRDFEEMQNQMVHNHAQGQDDEFDINGMTLEEFLENADSSMLEKFVNLHKYLDKYRQHYKKVQEREYESEIKAIEQGLSDAFSNDTVEKGVKMEELDVRNIGDVLGKRAHDETNEVIKNYLKDAIVGVNLAGKSGSANKALQDELDKIYGAEGGLDFYAVSNAIQNNRNTVSSKGGAVLDMNDVIKQLGVVGKELSMNQTKFEELDNTVSSVGDAWDKMFELQEGELKNQIKTIPLIGKAFEGNVVGIMATVAAFVALGQAMVKVSDTYKEIILKNTQLAKGMAQVNSAVRLFSDGSGIKGFKDDMNLTREQAGQLADTFRQIGLKGTVSFTQISTLAAGIRKQFGELDTSLLKEAVDLVSELPKEQIDILINGKGNLDDKASLIANLMESGKLEQAANLIARGAFGEVEGVTPQMSEAEKRIIELNAKMESSIDEIKGRIVSFIPASVRSSSLVVSRVAAIAAVTGKYIAATVATAKGVKSLSGASRGNSIAVTSPSAKTAPSPSSNMNKTMQIIGIGLAIATALHELSMYMQSRREEQRKSERQSAKESALENEQKYGVYASSHINENVPGQSATQGLSTGAKWGAYGAIGTAIALTVANVVAGITTAGTGSVALTPATIASWTAGIAAIGVLLGTVADATSESLKLTEENNDAKNFLASLQKLQLMEKRRNELLGKAGIEVKDTKKAILEMNKLSKRNSMIGEGVFSRGEYTKANYGINGIDLMSKIGGSASGFEMAVTQAIDNTFKGAIKDMDRIQSQKRNIATNTALGGEEKLLELADLRKNEIKAYERLISTLQKSIGQYEKIPSAVEASIKNAVASALLNNASNNFVGTGNTASILSQNAGEASLRAMEDVARQFETEYDKINSMMKEIDDQLKKGVAFAMEQESLQQEQLDILGLQQSTDEKSALSNARIVNDLVKSGDKRMFDIARGNESTRNLAIFTEESLDVAKSFRTLKEEIDGIEEGEFKEKYGGSKLKSFKDEQISSIIAEMGKFETQKGNLTPDQLNEYDIAKSQMMDAIEALGSADNQEELTKALEKVNRTMSSTAILFKERVENLTWGSKQGQQFLNSSEGKQYGAAKKLESVYATLSDATNNRVLKEQMMADTLQKSQKQYESIIKGWGDAINAVRNSADVLYSDIMMKTREKSLAFDTSARGSSAILEANAFDLQNLVARQKSNEEAGRQIDEYRRRWDEFVQGEIDSIGDQNAKDYMNLLARQAEARQNYMMNPTAANGNALAEMDAAVNSFESQFKDQINEWKTGNDVALKKGLSMVGQFGTLVKQQVEAISDWKADLVNVIERIPKRIQDGIESMPGARFARSQTERASAYGAVAAMNVDFGGMKKSLDLVMKYSAMERDIKIKGLKQVRNQELRAIDERLSELKKNANADQSQIRALEETRRTAIATTDAKIMQTWVEAAGKAMKQIEERANSQLEAIGRRTEFAEIQKDLYETIGAPFEYILDIEQDLVRQARNRAEIEQKIYEEMLQGDYTREQLEQQRLKAAKAGADVIKASFGAQRSALDKLLGSMMGTFEQIGGIFGPDSEYMKARKAGQGYTQLPSGMISASGGTVTGYANRVQGLNGAAKTGRGQAEVFGYGRGIPRFANGGWTQLEEGMNNKVGGMSGDNGKAITPAGRMVKMNRKEAVFNYDTLKKLAEPFGQSAEEFVANALNGNPYGIAHAAKGWTNMSIRDAFSKDRRRYNRKYHERYENTQMMEAQAIAAQNFLGASNMSRNNTLTSAGLFDLVSSNPMEAVNQSLRNSAFGGLSENPEQEEQSTIDKNVEKIREILEKFFNAEIISKSGEKKNENEMKKDVKDMKKDVNKQTKNTSAQNQRRQGVVGTATQNAGRSTADIRKENEHLYGRRQKQGDVGMTRAQIARVSQNKDELAARAMDAMLGGAAGTSVGAKTGGANSTANSNKRIQQFLQQKKNQDEDQYNGMNSIAKAGNMVWGASKLLKLVKPIGSFAGKLASGAAKAGGGKLAKLGTSMFGKYAEFFKAGKGLASEGLTTSSIFRMTDKSGKLLPRMQRISAATGGLFEKSSNIGKMTGIGRVGKDVGKGVGKAGKFVGEVGKGVGKGVGKVGKTAGSMAGTALQIVDAVLAGYGAIEGGIKAGSQEYVNKQMEKNYKNYGGEDINKGGALNVLKGIGKGALASMDFLEHGRNIGTAGRLMWDTYWESKGQDVIAEAVSKNASNAQKSNILRGVNDPKLKEKFDAKKKEIMESDEYKKKYADEMEKASNEYGWKNNFAGNLFSLGGHKRSADAHVKGNMEIWANERVKEELADEIKKAHELQKKENKVKEQTVKSNVAKGTAVKAKQTAVQQPERTEQTVSPRAKTESAIDTRNGYAPVQRGRDAYAHGTGNVAADKAIDTLSKMAAGKEEVNNDLDITVHVLFNDPILEQKVVRIGRKHFQSMLHSQPHV